MAQVPIRRVRLMRNIVGGPQTDHKCCESSSRVREEDFAIRMLSELSLEK